MLPQTFFPKFAPRLTRIGRNNDGGYVVSSTSVRNTKMIIGLGLADDWSFEKELLRETGAEVICVDHTVTGEFWRRKAILALIKMLAFQQGPSAVVKQIRTWRAYHQFFDGHRIVHERKKVGGVGVGGTNLTSLLEGCPEKGVFLKVDIEGWEYRILEEILDSEGRFSGIVIEFHDVDLHRERIEEFIQKLRLPLVHIHGNNAASLDKHGDPIVIEMTFGHQTDRQINKSRRMHYPVSGLDQPNDIRHEEIKLNFEGITHS